MSTFFSGLGVILALELRQRIRGIAWYVLIGIFIVLVALVTVAVGFTTSGFGIPDDEDGNAIFGVIIYFVLLLGSLVAPALSGNAINGDRDAGTLATTQVTLITTWQLILGKFFAAWITALAFLVASLPFLIYAVASGGVATKTLITSIIILAIELGVVAAIGVGLSGLFSKPLFSIVVTYLVVAALGLGTVITFGLAGAATQSTKVTTWSYGDTYDEESGQALTCLPPQVETSPVPRFDLYWPVLAANPFVVLADAAGESDLDGDSMTSGDFFTGIKYGVRYAQIAPELDEVYDDCADIQGTPENEGGPDYPTEQEVLDSTVPTWFVGLAIQIALGVLALLGAWSRTKTPARALSKGSRIA